MKNFKDKVVVITGAGSGMGRSYALMFAKLGSKVALCDYDEKGLKETEKLVMQAANVQVYAEKLDVSNKASVYAFAQGVKAAAGQWRRRGGERIQHFWIGGYAQQFRLLCQQVCGARLYRVADGGAFKQQGASSFGAPGRYQHQHCEQA